MDLEEGTEKRDEMEMDQETIEGQGLMARGGA